MSPTSSTAPEATHRPRVEGEREQEILEATLEVLGESGYDRLTMDAVAARAKASKATLYRRWNGKAALVIDALCSHKEWEEDRVPDTGSLADDLRGAFCGMGGLTDVNTLAVLGAVLTAIGRDGEFAEAFRRDFIAPKEAASRRIFERAVERGEISADVDLDIIVPALPGIILHRALFLGELPTTELIDRVIDNVIVPAVTRG
ncbi:TetR/AcrR family transcriptional regulator [Nocardioides sp. TF02-7]|uniref:TetR/AcrR family transcriptional regulator n=1 Tax=Nocardioides sp. TF02-7 TaxID=2917724 RepID=UPI001F063AE7|nr:TetR/AcrR family transcriptional regulator [Nocardioides sp. TF02-7]UMG93143.1 TetR/AcrR family transcriptional regulator [Nocardioides sp. TF02-7]